MTQNDADHEFDLFRQLAEAIGESLEAVYNMLEKEREELINVLGLRRGNNNDSGGENLASEETKGQVQIEEDIVKLFNDDSDTLVLDKVQFEYSDSSDVFDKETIVEATEVEEDDPNNNKSQNHESKFGDVHPKLISLQKDADLVLKLLGPNREGLINADLVLAYLEAHMDRPDRVQVVVEELAGVDQDESQTPERQLSVEMTKPDKGKGKSSKIANVSDVEARLTQAVAQKRKNPPLPTEEEAQSPNKKTCLELKGIYIEDEPNLPTVEPSQPTITPIIVLTKDPATIAAIMNLVDWLSDMFPQTPLDYLKARCQDLVGKEAAIARFTDELLSSPTPPPGWRQTFPVASFPPSPARISSTSSPGPSGVQSASSASSDRSPVLEWETERHEELLSIFPTISPQYLKRQVLAVSRVEGPHGSQREVTKELDIAFQSRVEMIWSMTPDERKELPTRTQWEQKEKEEAELKKWSGNMTPGDFLDMYEDPAKYFSSRREVSEEYKAQALAYLKRKFRFQSITSITRTFARSGQLLSVAVKQLKQAGNTRSTRRADAELWSSGGSGGQPCIAFLKEKKFIKLEEEISKEKVARVKAQEWKVSAARLAGALVECECCYSPDCLEEDMVSCGGGHKYCKECVETSTKVAMGEGRTRVACLGQCDEEISWQQLSRALQPNVLSKLIQKRQAAEVAEAGLEGVVACPYCPYLTIMDNMEDKVLVCRNPDCGRESCRLCREPNHIPLRCEEVEKGEQARKMVEEKLTMAMLRECVKCMNKFYKEEGCNKMTCRCGAQMCYLCKQEVTDYSHFYGQGGKPTATKTCPLWSDNAMLHKLEVARAAEQAKQELSKDGVTMSSDPTQGIVTPDTLPVSEEEVRGRLFNRWLEVTARVQRMINGVEKVRLEHLLDTARGKIAGQQVRQLEDQIRVDLDLVLNQAEVGRNLPA